MIAEFPKASLRPGRVTDQLVEQLARSIVSGRMPPGVHLPSESELAARFGISKVGVREAIGVLATLGLVQVQQGKRTVVKSEPDWSILSPVIQQALRLEFGSAYVLNQLYEIRLILEPACASLAAERATDVGIEELQVLLTELRTIERGQRDARSFLEIDLAIHDSVGRLVQNPSLRAMNADLLRHMLDNWADSRVTGDDLPGLVEEHARIVAAIAGRDADAARTAMEDHILRAWEVEVGRRSRGGVRADTDGRGRAAPAGPLTQSTAFATTDGHDGER